MKLVDSQCQNIIVVRIICLQNLNIKIPSHRYNKNHGLWFTLQKKQQTVINTNNKQCK